MKPFLKEIAEELYRSHGNRLAELCSALAKRAAKKGQAHILARIGVCGKIRVVCRTARIAPEGMVFHVLKRSVGRMQVSRAGKDHLDAVQRVVEQKRRAAPMRICTYCRMPNH